MISNTFMQIPSDTKNILELFILNLSNFKTYLTHSAIYVALYSEAIFLDSARAAIQLVSSWEKRRLTSKIFPTAATADKIEIPLLLLLENWMLNLRIDVLNTPCSFKFLKWWKL